MEDKDPTRTAQDNKNEVRQPRCPMCGGALVTTRDQYRCSRCLFNICVGCEGDESPNIAPDRDT